ncbi:response regulator transcription factor [Ruminococcus sp.]|uniref:response regulator transcription factor n=1 Tax=Ruminococcus sp. TaxID=41978 RepID=UPI00292ED4C0|nr:response regulator transcription factor [Ruminococcus sp.]MEE1262361.1 response regulator transcription factor [Ruminococcus sp.]
MKLLLIEDNKGIAKGLEFSLQGAGYETELCHNCEQAYAKIGGDYAVIIIDISLPDGNGFDLYKDIRRVNSSPVIFLTALDDEDSIVRGFDLGAEDYITKPFSTRELIARVKRLTRKSESTVTVGEITLDLDKQAVFKESEKVEFTALEYRVCSLLIQNHGAVVTREMILEKIWDIAGNYVSDNTLSVYIRRIRQKLGADKIKTVKGAGYRMEDV